MSTVIIVTSPSGEDPEGRGTPKDKKVTVNYAPPAELPPGEVAKELARIQRLADKIVSGAD